MSPSSPEGFWRHTESKIVVDSPRWLTAAAVLGIGRSTLLYRALTPDTTD
jgi:hypothetical protein